jgi:hypothetical protein
MSENIERDFPRNRKVVPPHKLKTRETAKMLEAAGFNILKSSSGMKNLYFLVKEAPELLQRVTDAMLAASEDHDLWNYVIGNDTGYRFSATDIRDPRWMYEKWLVLAPIGHTLMPNEKTGTGLFRTISVIEHLLRNAYPDVRAINPVRYAALIIIFRIMKDERIAMSDDDRETLTDFMEQNLDSVVAVLPEFVRRGTLDRGVIESLFRVQSSALLEGAL